MKKVPKGRYTKEFQEENVTLVKEERLALSEAALRLPLPISTLKAGYRHLKQVWRGR